MSGVSPDLLEARLVHFLVVEKYGLRPAKLVPARTFRYLLSEPSARSASWLTALEGRYPSPVWDLLRAAEPQPALGPGESITGSFTEAVLGRDHPSETEYVEQLIRRMLYLARDEGLESGLAVWMSFSHACQELRIAHGVGQTMVAYLDSNERDKRLLVDVLRVTNVIPWAYGPREEGQVLRDMAAQFARYPELLRGCDGPCLERLRAAGLVDSSRV